MYLTYIEYQAYGGTLDNTSFINYEFRARAEIDWVTFNRLKNDTKFDDSVKMCMFAIIGELQKIDALSSVVTMDGVNNNTTTAAVSGMSNDGVSVSYNIQSANDGITNAKANIKDVISKYLQGTTNELRQKLLYRGIYPNE